MPSHREILQTNLDKTAHAYREAVEESTRLDAQLKADRNAIDELNDRYNTACRQLATGAAAEPAAILAERDRRSHKLRGLETLFAEATASIAPLDSEHQKAQRAMQEEFDREERERLEAVIADAQGKTDAAQAALNEAQKAQFAAVSARSRFLRQQELKARATA